MEDKLKVLRIMPGKAPEEVEIDSGLSALQEQVGGYIEQICPFEDEVAVICNEEGKLDRLPLNRAIYDPDTGEMVDIIAGTMLIVYAPSDRDSYQSMPSELMEKYKEQFKKMLFFSCKSNICHSQICKRCLSHPGIQTVVILKKRCSFFVNCIPKLVHIFIYTKNRLR